MIPKLTEEQRKLAEDNMALAYYVISKHFDPPALKDEDLVSEGYIGLCKAAAGFNPDAGYKFTTYATKCILQQLGLYLRSTNRLRKRAQNTAISLNLRVLCNGNDMMELVDLVPDRHGRTEDIAINNIMSEQVSKYAPTVVAKEMHNIPLSVQAEAAGLSKQRLWQKYHWEVAKVREKFPELCA